MKQVKPLLAVAGGVLLAAGLNAQMSSSQPQMPDTTHSAADKAANMPELKSFAMKAADGGMAEVELGRLAVQKAGSDRVKQFGQKMVDDHSKANDALKAAADREGIQLPAETGAKNKKLMD